MNINMHGRQISEISWPDGGVMTPARGEILYLSATHHGDHDEFWIVRARIDGTEIARWNPRYVEGFHWATDDGAKKIEDEEAPV